MPHCPGCWATVPEEASFCPSCGRKIETGSVAGETQPPANARMPKYEYKTITVAPKGIIGKFSSRMVPELERVLNREAHLGWRLCRHMMPSDQTGQSYELILVFERELR